MKSTEIKETPYSRIDRAKFVEDSLTGTNWVNPTTQWNFPEKLIL